MCLPSWARARSKAGCKGALRLQSVPYSEIPTKTYENVFLCRRAISREKKREGETISAVLFFFKRSFLCLTEEEVVTPNALPEGQLYTVGFPKVKSIARRMNSGLFFFSCVAALIGVDECSLASYG